MKIGETMNESYLTEETLKKRIKDLSKKASKEVLIVIGSGASNQKEEAEIKENLEAMMKRANRSLGFSATEVVVLYDRVAKKLIRKTASDRVVDRIALNRAKGERVVVIPFNFGRKETNMMSVWNRFKRQISKFDNIVANGKGVIPYKNVGIWLEKEANFHLPLSNAKLAWS